MRPQNPEAVLWRLRRGQAGWAGSPRRADCSLKALQCLEAGFAQEKVPSKETCCGQYFFTNCESRLSPWSPVDLGGVCRYLRQSLGGTAGNQQEGWGTQALTKDCPLQNVRGTPAEQHKSIAPLPALNEVLSELPVVWVKILIL